MATRIDPHAPVLPLPSDVATATRRRRLGVPFAAACVLLLGAVTLALLQGPTDIPPGVVGRVLLARTLQLSAGDLPAAADQIVWHLRVPRVLLALFVGGTLAVAGTAYQGVFRNPLADPYLIGVAAGAGLGASLAFASPWAASWRGLSIITPAAFAGALLAVSLAYLLARSTAAPGGAGLILAGIAIAALCNAGTSFFFFYNNTRTLNVLAWLMGGFNTASWSKLWALVPYALPCIAVVWLHARLLNVLLLDEEQARQVGVAVERVKLTVLAAASLAAAAAVSVSGIIGFVGLVAPHVARMLAGPDHRATLPLALIGGALLMVSADLVARTALAPLEIPVGVITAFIGGPFFLYLLARGRRRPW